MSTLDTDSYFQDENPMFLIEFSQVASSNALTKIALLSLFTLKLLSKLIMSRDCVAASISCQITMHHFQTKAQHCAQK